MQLQLEISCQAQLDNLLYSSATDWLTHLFRSSMGMLLPISFWERSHTDGCLNYLMARLLGMYRRFLHQFPVESTHWNDGFIWILLQSQSQSTDVIQKRRKWWTAFNFWNIWRGSIGYVTSFCSHLNSILCRHCFSIFHRDVFYFYSFLLRNISPLYFNFFCCCLLVCWSVLCMLFCRSAV